MGYAQVFRGGVPPALLREAGGRVDLLHVHELRPGEGTLVDVSAQSPLSEVGRHEIERQLRASVPPDAEARGILTHVAVVQAPAAAESFLPAAERLDVDVVALASHGRTGLERAMLGSVAEQVARHSTRPVLIIRQADGG